MVFFEGALTVRVSNFKILNGFRATEVKFNELNISLLNKSIIRAKEW